MPNEKRKPTREIILDKSLNGLLGILFVGGRADVNVNLVNDLITIKQGGSLLQTKALRFNDEDVAEHQLDGEPAAVDDLRWGR
jgi:hypothetical protein